VGDNIEPNRNGSGCVCEAGYHATADAKGSCADVDECADMNGGCDVHSECANTLGGRTCGASRRAPPREACVHTHSYAVRQLRRL
jgi:hypothetical protein